MRNQNLSVKNAVRGEDNANNIFVAHFVCLKDKQLYHLGDCTSKIRKAEMLVMTRFGNGSHLKRHMTSHSSKGFPCSHCRWVSFILDIDG